MTEPTSNENGWANSWVDGRKEGRTAGWKDDGKAVYRGSRRKTASIPI